MLRTLGFYSKVLELYFSPWDYALNPEILLQNLGFCSEIPGIILQTLEFYSKPWDFTPNPGFLLQPLEF